MKKKSYIFITNGIKDVGGVELYILNKCLWLEKNGWDTFVISAAYTRENYKIEALERFKVGNIPCVRYAPFECGGVIRQSILNKLRKYVTSKGTYEESIIESHSGASALWGELLAEEIGAKHIVLFLMESFEESSYMIQKEFFVYKLKRKEVFAGKHAIDVLYRDKLNVNESLLKNNNVSFLQENPVADVENEKLEQIKESDYSICYIGRPEKIYFENILEGVCSFARKHSRDKIQFIVIGNIKKQQRIIDTKCYGIKNLTLVLLGEIVPIPRRLFSMVDVVCAGSGSARCAANENVPTIIGDADNGMSNGVYGYDTLNSVGRDVGDKQTSFEVSLEDVLVEKNYLKKPNKLQPEPTVEDCCIDNLKKINQSSDIQEYYGKSRIYKGYCSIKRRILTTVLFFNPNTLSIIEGMGRNNGK